MGLVNVRNSRCKARWAAIGAICAGVAALAGSSAAGAADHACDYLSRSEVARVLETTVSEAEPQPANPMGQSICVFDLPASGGLGLVQLQMLRTAWAKNAGAGLTAPALFENSMAFLDQPEAVAGIGEKAFWGGTGIRLGAGLHVLIHDTYLTIGVETGDALASREKARELAALVVEKLK